MNDKLRFLSEEEIIYIHDNQITIYGGQHGIRSHELLNSAINHVKSEFDGIKLYNNPVEIASAYIYHLCQNHCFIDGNKRTALVVGLVFLDLNGIEISDPNGKLYDMMIEITLGKISKTQIQKIIFDLTVDL